MVGNTIIIEVDLSMEQVIAALQSIYTDFLEQQQLQMEADAPRVICSELQARSVLAVIPIHPAWPEPKKEKTFRTFNFSGDWKHIPTNGKCLKKIWTLDIEAEGVHTRIYLQMMDEQPAQYHILYRMLTALVKTWALEHQRSQAEIDVMKQVGEVLEGKQGSTQKHELLLCNRWLIEQYFNQGNTDYKSLVDEWMRIREEQDYKERPAKPVASMRTAINEERKRRNKHRNA